MQLSLTERYRGALLGLACGTLTQSGAHDE